MRFDLVDRVLEQAADRIVTIKQVSMAEEYLQDHFPSFPVLPGVFMLEAMIQAGRRLAMARPEAAGLDRPLVLGRVRALKYGHFVRPGAVLRVELTLGKVETNTGEPSFDLKGSGVVLEPGVAAADAPTACSGRFVLRPARTETRPAAALVSPRSPA